MSILIAKYDIFEYRIKKKVVPISKPLYDYLDNLMDKFIIWYKSNKPIVIFLLKEYLL